MECSERDSGVTDNAHVQRQPPKLRVPAITGYLLLITRVVINPQPWTPFSDLPQVTHRLRAIDPA